MRQGSLGSLLPLQFSIKNLHPGIEGTIRSFLSDRSLCFKFSSSQSARSIHLYPTSNHQTTEIKRISASLQAADVNATAAWHQRPDQSVGARASTTIWPHTLNIKRYHQRTTTIKRTSHLLPLLLLNQQSGAEHQLTTASKVESVLYNLNRRNKHSNGLVLQLPCRLNNRLISPPNPPALANTIESKKMGSISQTLTIRSLNLHGSRQDQVAIATRGTRNKSSYGASLTSNPSITTRSGPSK